METIRKSTILIWRRFFKNGVLLILTGAFLAPQGLWAYGYQQLKERRARENKAAAKLYFSEKKQAPQPYEEVGPISRKAKTRLACEKRLRRTAWRDEGDGVIEVQYQAPILSTTITCQGILIRWKEGETQPETRP